MENSGVGEEGRGEGMGEETQLPRRSNRGTVSTVGENRDDDDNVVDDDDRSPHRVDDNSSAGE